jgi:hypothetical protein
VLVLITQFRGLLARSASQLVGELGTDPPRHPDHERLATGKS